jgi:EmrB/QacA subfamily drug resistance transporter
MPGRRSSLVLAVTALGSFLPFLDATIVNIAFPAIRRSFPGTPLSELSWVLNAYNVVFAALLLPAGRLADLVGRRRLFNAGLLVFTVASALCAAAPSPAALVAARVVQAVGAAAIIPSSLALLLPAFPLERRATAVGLLGGAAAVAAASGPALGGILIDLSDWPLVFLVNLPIAALTLVLGRKVLDESRDPGSGAPDVVGTVELAGGLGLLALGLVQSDPWGWGDGRVLAAFAASALLIGGGVARARAHPSPALDLSLVRRGPLAAANAGTLAFAAAFFAKILADALFLTSVWDYSVLTAGLAITPGPLISAAFAGPAGRLADRFGHRVVAVPGCVLYALGCLWFAIRVGSEPAWVADWLPGTFLTGVGVAFAWPQFTSAAVMTLPPARFGIGSAANAAARQIGAVLGIALLVAIVGTPAPDELLSAFDDAWVYSAVVAALAALIGVHLAARRPAPA